MNPLNSVRGSIVTGFIIALVIALAGLTALIISLSIFGIELDQAIEIHAKALKHRFGKRATLLVGTGDDSRFVPEQPGYYEIRGGGRSDFIAVNIDPRESRLERLPPEAVERWLALRPAEAVDTASPAGG